MLIAALALLAHGPSLATRDPWNPDEPRYIEVAREMVVTGEYLVPQLNGVQYPDKPAPVFWLFAVFYRLGFGIQGGRVVALLATVGTLWLTCVLGRRLYGPAVGLLAALVTLTSGLFLYISNCGVLDPPLTFFVVLSIFCGHRALHAAERRGRWWLGFYAAIACGILTKGPVALAAPGLVVLAYGVVRRHEVRPGGAWHLAGAALMLALVAAWLVPACVRGGEDYARNILLHQTMRRVAESESHRQPPWFYLAQSPAYFFPWTFPFVLALVWAARSAGRPRGAGLEGVWFVVMFVFFSAVSGKRERYLLPIVPAAGLLMARYLVAVAREAARATAWHRWFWRVTFVLMAVVGGALVALGALPGQWARALEDRPADLAILDEALTTGPIVAAVASGVALLLVSFAGARRPGLPGREPHRARALVCGVLVLALGLQLAMMPVLNRFKSSRYFVQAARPYLVEADRVYLHESDLSGVCNLFTGRVHMDILDNEAVAGALASRERVAVLAREGARGDVPRLVRRTWGHVAVSRRVGSNLMFLIANWKRPAAP